jgi:hypothetical protein
MSFPFLGNYPWGEGKKRAAVHSFTAKREHEDLSLLARIMNNISAEAVPGQKNAFIEKNGESWKIKVPGQTSIDPVELTGLIETGLEVNNHTLSLHEVSICVGNITKHMLILGSEPY